MVILLNYAFLIIDYESRNCWSLRYVGGEVLRLLLSHPKVEVSMVTSRQHVGNFYISST